MALLSRLIVGLISITILNLAQGQTVSTTCPLIAKTAVIEGGTVSYLQGGKGPPVLLLHGLFGQKEQWMEMGCALANQGFNVIAPDLPGYGQSAAYPVTVYPLESQVNMLHRFMNQVNGESFHVAGNSMGGAISALYANQYPKEIKTLAFIGAPLGVIGWSDQVRESIFQGVNPFIPVNVEQFDLEMRLLFSRAPSMNEEIKAQLTKEYLENNRHYQQVWDIVNFYGNSLNQLPKQSIRTLIIWGRDDGIFSIAGLPILKKKFPNSHSYPLDNAGHLIMLEEPSKIVRTYSQFLSKSN